MRFRSKKREALYRQRRPFVAQMLTEFPICQRCHTNPSQDVHELKSRARGGSILDASNCVAICRSCHVWIGLNPLEAMEEGWLRPSWWSDEPRPQVRYCQRHGGQEVTEAGVCVVCDSQGITP